MPAQICVSNFQPGGNQLLGLFVNGMPAQICVSNFQPGGNQLLGLLINVDAGSNLRKQFSAGGGKVIGTLRKWGSRPKSAYAIFSRGTISYWDFL